MIIDDKYVNIPILIFQKEIYFNQISSHFCILKNNLQQVRLSNMDIKSIFK